MHGQLLAKGGKNGPVCMDCHSAHEIDSPEGNNFKAASDEKCGSCHKDRLEHYRDTYHGKAMLLGRPNLAPEVAACYDCHGYHDVLPPSNPGLPSVPGEYRRHMPEMSSGGHGQFCQYIPHANPMDATHYPAIALDLRRHDRRC